MVSGCATTVDGNAVSQAGSGRSKQRPSSTSAPTPADADAAADLLGELTTIDPCSLIDPREFSAFGTAKLGVPDSLDDCLVEIKTSAPEPIALYLGSLDRAEAVPDLNAKPSADLGGGLRVIAYDGDTTYCNKLLVFPDGVTLSVNASLYEGEEPRLCDIVDVGMSRAVQALRAGKVKHRDFRSNSLGRIDPCTIVATNVVAAVPGLGSVAPKDYPGKHSCAWTAPDNNTRLRVMFIAGPAPKPSGQGATESTVFGRSTVFSPTPEAGSYAFCGAQTGHIPFAAGGQAGVVEIASVFVRMQKGKVDEACRAATDVANAVWPKLPKP
jgi:hypothetical protein